MPLTGAKFLGLTVADVNARAAWGGSSGSLSVNLVRDRAAGDIPQPVPEGTPCYFELFGLKYWGLLQQWQASTSAAGTEVYTATLSDPRDILAGAQVVTGDYAGAVAVPNLINAYGWWEAQGYGASGATPAGMPWANVRLAVLAMVNGGATPYGGPLTYRGVSYGLDLSDLPVPPAYYRIGGDNQSLLQLIDTVCRDAGLDYFVDLVGFLIRVRTASRNLTQPLGTIQALVAANRSAGALVQGSYGAEARNEPTSVFLVGGKRTVLRTETAFASFWGYDGQARPITGAPLVHPNYGGVVESMTLYAPGLADILGTTAYPTNTLEMRCALADKDTWEMYVEAYKPAVRPLVSGIHVAGAGAAAAAAAVGVAGFAAMDLAKDNKANLTELENQTLENNGDRIYTFLRTVAERYYGRQFLVRVPFALSHTDPDSLQITYSHEPADAGYLAEGAAALGISAANEEVLLAPDERILPFAYWPDAVTLCEGRFDANSSAVEGTKCWQRVRQSQRLVFLDDTLPVPCVHVEVPDPVFELDLDQWGVEGDVDKLLLGGAGGAAAIDLNQEGGTAGEIALHPQARYPTTFGVALKSNTEVYGPWFVAAADGGVRYERDDNLTPWDCGGWDAMEQIALARVSSGAAAVQVVEAGDLTVVGPPAYSVGDVLAAGGPNMTGTEVRFGTGGATVTYRWSTFTPRFGGFNRQYEERLRRQAAAALELRKGVRRALARANVSAQVAANQRAARRSTLAAYQKRKSPHTTLMARVVDAGAGDRVLVSTETHKAALFLSNPTRADARNAAVVSWDALLRPYTFDATASGWLLPRVTPPSAFAGGLTASSYAPFGGTGSVNAVTSRSPAGYSGVNQWAVPVDPGTARAVGLKGPLWVVGWGPSAYGGAVPTGAASRARDHKAGPVDMLWDDFRGVWTSHDVVTAKVPPSSTIPAGGSGLVWVGGNSGWPLAVFNPWSVVVPSSGRATPFQIMAAYTLNEGRWNVIAADCG